MAKWHTILECKNCGASGVLEHNEETYPDYCPHCGLDGHGATGSPKGIALNEAEAKFVAIVLKHLAECRRVTTLDEWLGDESETADWLDDVMSDLWQKLEIPTREGGV
jgi:hypothetical protein